MIDGRIEVALDIVESLAQRASDGGVTQEARREAGLEKGGRVGG